jgi:hypothetical protein
MSELPTSLSTDQPENRGESIKVVFVDQSEDARDAARDYADARLDRELTEGGTLKRFMTGIWKGNIAKEFYRQKYIREAESTIQQTNDMYLGTVSPEDRAEITDVTISRFQQQNEEFYHSDAGERRQVQRNDDPLTEHVKELIREYASGSLDRDGLARRKDEVLKEYRDQYGDELLGKGIAKVDNLIAVAEAVTGNIEHYGSLDNAINAVEVVVGEARNGARTEARYSAVDKGVDWLSKTRVGSLVNPGTLATVVAATLAITRAGTHSVIGSAAATIAPGAVAGVWAGVRENKRVKDERAQHARELAVGGSYDGQEDKRRIEMEATRYETVTAVSLVDELKSLAEESQLSTGKEAVQAALEALARAQARVSLSDEKNIDLISYTSQQLVARERMALDLARYEARMALEGHLDTAMRAELGLPLSLDVRHIVKAHADQFATETLTQDMSEKDAAFQKLKRKRVLNAAAIGTIVGVAGGLVAQEAVAAVDPSRFGLLDLATGAQAQVHTDGQIHQTILEGALKGDTTTIHTEAASSLAAHETVPHSSVSVNSDYEWSQNDTGTYDILNPNGEKTIEGVTVQPDGSIDATEIARLEATGFNVHETVTTETITEKTSEQVDLNTYFERHSGETEPVSIDKWYDNDTPYSDQNELRLYRGGDNGITEGGYRLEAGGMTADGSWIGGERVNPIEAAQQGNIVLAISRMGEDSGPMFVVQGDADGGFNIANGTPEAALFRNVDGHVELAEGLRASVYLKEGIDANGVMHGGSLATMIGEAPTDGTFTDVVETTKEIPHYHYEITSNGYDTTYQNFTEIAPITPVASRRSLEAIEAYRSRERGSENAYYYGAGASDERKRKWREERSPRLKRNPDADLHTGQELAWYRDEQDRKRGRAYLNEIDAYVEANPALNSIDDNIKAIVNIPVSGADESENIYRTLSMFAHQDDQASIDQSIILLNVNWKEAQARDPEQYEKIQKTIAEVERARQDFPNLKIASFTKVWSDEFVQSKTYIDDKGNEKVELYGEVIKVLYDTTAFALDTAIKAGRRTPDSEALLITNDADTEGMSRSYLRNYIRTFEQNPKQDAFTGLIRRGTEAYKDYPGYGVVSAFYSMMAITMPRRQIAGLGGGFSTDGPNSGLRVSMYAAMGGADESVGAGADGLLQHRMTEVRQADGTPTPLQRLLRIDGRKGSSRVIGRFVSGAAIDTVPDRLLNAYKRGEWIGSAWDNYDSAGYQTREESAINAVLEPENPEVDIDSIARRIETSIEGFGSFWWHKNPGAMESAMAFCFGKTEKGRERTLYHADWDFTRPDNDRKGTLTFRFTEEGKKWLKDRLLYDSQGQRDPYGERLRRQLYNDVRAGAARTPFQAEPRMLS